MPKGVQGKIWSSVISKLALIGLVSLLFWVIGDSFHLIPQSLKDLVGWFANNFTLIAFSLCFMVGAYVCLRIIQTQRARAGRH